MVVVLWKRRIKINTNIAIRADMKNNGDIKKDHSRERFYYISLSRLRARETSL